MGDFGETSGTGGVGDGDRKLESDGSVESDRSDKSRDDGLFVLHV